MFTNIQRRVQITIPLPQPPQAGAVSREISISCDGAGTAVFELGATATQYVTSLPRNSKVHVELVDVDAAGNHGVALVSDFVAVTAAQLPAPAATSGPPVIVEIPQPVRTAPGPGQPGGSSFVQSPGTAP